eukprot:jgi/Chrzof1/11787/Cz06g10040.t1
MPYQPCSYEEAETSGSAESASDVDDEELARRLQSEEHNALYQRMLEMSGFGPDGVDGYEPDDALDPDQMTYEGLTALGEAVGTVSKGLAPDAIKSLPQVPLKQLRAAKGNHKAVFDQDM